MATPPPPVTRVPRRSPLDFLASLCLLAFLFQSGGAILCNSVVYDEGPHIAAGLSAWLTGDFSIYQVNPPLGRLWSTLPLALMGVRIPQEGANWGVVIINQIGLANPIDFHHLVMIARIPSLALTLALGLILFRQARKAGPEAGLAAALLFSFQPMLIAHGTLATVEPASVLFFYAAVAMFVEREEKGWTFAWAVGTGVIAGAAMVSKFSCFSLLPIFALVHFAVGPSAGWRPNLRGAGRTAAATAAALLVINAGYFFHQTCFRLSDVHLESRLLEWTAMLPGWTRVPLPMQLVAGFEQQTRFNEERGGSKGVTLRGGVWRPGPDNTFFLRLTAIKLTVPLLLLAVIAAVRAMGRDGPEGRRTRAFLLAAVVHFFIMAYMAANYHGFRYILQIVPLLIASAAALWSKPWPGPRWKRLALVLLASSSLWTGAWTFPYYLPYNNVLHAGGPDSPDPDWCADWGQGLISLREWRARHPKGKLFLCYLGSIDPQLYHIDWQVPPLAPEPGFWAISRTQRFGPSPHNELVFVRDARVVMIHATGPIFRWMEKRTPVAVLAGSILVYKVE